MKRTYGIRTPQTVRRPEVRSKKPRRLYVPRPIPGLRMGMVNIQRTFWNDVWTPSTVATNNFWRYYAPNFTQLPSNAELAAVFDQYRINAVKITLRPRYDNFAGNDTTDTTPVGVTNQGGNHVHVIVDPLSNTAPSGTYTTTNLNSFLENGKVRTYTGTQPISIYYKPKIAIAGQGINDQQRVSPKYLSMVNSGSVSQNGVHIFISDVNMTGIFGQSYDVFFTYYMTLRGLK